MVVQLDSIGPFKRCMIDLGAGLLHHDLIQEKDISIAFRRQEVELYYQPQIELTTGQPAGSEALLRSSPFARMPSASLLFKHS